ncbi:hypothetical protein BHE74_00050700 [Ensete ventricosum]|nr:hypothetical protein BHE74_00050700 [Ensete ventricosum]
MRLGTRQECIGSLPGWRKGVRQKKTETHRKIIGGSRKACWEFNHDGMSYISDMNPRSSLGIGPRIRRCGGSSSSVCLDFAEGIGKIARNTLGDRRRKTVRLAAGEVEGCRFAGVSESEERVSNSGAVGVEPRGWLPDCTVVMFGVPYLTSVERRHWPSKSRLRYGLIFPDKG